MLKPGLYLKEFLMITETVRMEFRSGIQTSNDALTAEQQKQDSCFICAFIAEEAREPSGPN